MPVTLEYTRTWPVSCYKELVSDVDLVRLGLLYPLFSSSPVPRLLFGPTQASKVSGQHPPPTNMRSV